MNIAPLVALDLCRSDSLTVDELLSQFYFLFFFDLFFDLFQEQSLERNLCENRISRTKFQQRTFRTNFK